MTAAAMTNQCTSCSGTFPANDLLVGPDGPVCTSCNLDADADAMMAAGVMRQAMIALGLSLVGGPVRVEINGINVVALATCPVGILLGIRALLTAKKVGSSKAMAASVAAIVIGTAVLGLTLLALMG